MSTNRVSLNAKQRTITGKHVKTLRLQGTLPAHVFGSGSQGVNLELNARDFVKVYDQVGETGLVDLHIEGESIPRPVLLVNVSRTPVKGDILHADLFQVNLKKKVTVNIPVEVIGESEAVKNGAVLVVSYNELEVEALPTDLPEKFEVDISKLLAMEDTITIANIAYDRNTITTTLAQDEIVVSLQAQEAEEVVEAAPSVEEVEITKGGPTTEEGKEAAAGAPAKEAAPGAKPVPPKPSEK